MLIDSHAHLTSPLIKREELEPLLERARAAGVEKIVNICTNPEELEAGLALEQMHPWIYTAASTTPHDVEKEGDLYFDAIARRAREGRLVAVGETGLDYHYDHSPKEVQHLFLRRYLRLAVSCQLPVVIHCREAFNDFFLILDEEYKQEGKHLPGVLHCFTGTVSEAEQVIERGWYLSLSGIVTFKKSEQLREVARLVPLDRLLIETDTPYLAPQKYRGKSNEPAFLIETAQRIAEVKGVSLEALAAKTRQNTIQLFKLKY